MPRTDLRHASPLRDLCVNLIQRTRPCCCAITSIPTSPTGRSYQWGAQLAQLLSMTFLTPRKAGQPNRPCNLSEAPRTQSGWLLEMHPTPLSSLCGEVPSTTPRRFGFLRFHLSALINWTTMLPDGYLEVSFGHDRESGVVLCAWPACHLTVNSLLDLGVAMLPLTTRLIGEVLRPPIIGRMTAKRSVWHFVLTHMSLGRSHTVDRVAPINIAKRPNYLDVCCGHPSTQLQHQM